MPAEGNRLIVSLDSTRPGDSVFVHDGRVMLVLDAQAAHALAQCTVDVLPNRHTEPQFVLRPSWVRKHGALPPVEASGTAPTQYAVTHDAATRGMGCPSPRSCVKLVPCELVGQRASANTQDLWCAFYCYRAAATGRGKRARVMTDA